MEVPMALSNGLLTSGKAVILMRMVRTLGELGVDC